MFLFQWLSVALKRGNVAVAFLATFANSELVFTAVVHFAYNILFSLQALCWRH